MASRCAFPTHIGCLLNLNSLTDILTFRGTGYCRIFFSHLIRDHLHLTQQKYLRVPSYAWPMQPEWTDFPLLPSLHELIHLSDAFLNL